jgi:hypothetical protein
MQIQTSHASLMQVRQIHLIKLSLALTVLPLQVKYPAHLPEHLSLDHSRFLVNRCRLVRSHSHHMSLTRHPVRQFAMIHSETLTTSWVLFLNAHVVQFQTPLVFAHRLTIRLL